LLAFFIAAFPFYINFWQELKNPKPMLCKNSRFGKIGAKQHAKQILNKKSAKHPSQVFI